MKIPGCLVATISIVGLFLNCTPNRFIPLNFQDSRTSIRPDSFLVIPLKGIPVNSFAFSPIELDKIWTTGVNNPSEIDLKTDSITLLTQKLGDWPIRGLKESEWAIDPYEPEKIWFAQFDLGAAQWSKKSGLVARFPNAKPATCFAFQPKIVWIGTQRYAAILDKYPDSELKPVIWMDLAGWHLYANEYEEQDDTTYFENLKVSKHFLDLIRNNFPEETREKGFKEMEERLGRVMERLLWEITIAPEKKEIQPGESVKMIVSFKNKAATPRNLHFWDQGYWLLDFQVEYLSEAGCQTVNAPFFEGEKPQAMNPSIIVNPGKTHREVIELSKLANKRGQYGRFDFSKKGVYDIYLEVGQESWYNRTRTSGARIFAQ